MLSQIEITLNNMLKVNVENFALKHSLGTRWDKRHPIGKVKPEIQYEILLRF